MATVAKLQYFSFTEHLKENKNFVHATSYHSIGHHLLHITHFLFCSLLMGISRINKTSLRKYLAVLTRYYYVAIKYICPPLSFLCLFLVDTGKNFINCLPVFCIFFDTLGCLTLSLKPPTPLCDYLSYQELHAKSNGMILFFLRNYLFLFNFIK